MSCGNDLIKIYFMVLFIMISVGQCKFEIATNIDIQDEKQLNPSLSGMQPTYYNKFLKILHLKRRSEEIDKKIKQKLNDIILQNKIELMKDQTKAQLLKIGNTCLENYSETDNKNGDSKRGTSATTKVERLKQNLYWKKNQNNYDVPKIKFDARKFLRSRKYRKNSVPNSKLLTRHELWKREDDDDKTTSTTGKEETTTSQEDSNHMLLEEIADELGEIRESINVTHKGHHKFLNGTWESELTGLTFTIKFHEDVAALAVKKPSCAHVPSTTSKCPTTKATTRNPLKVDKGDACLKIGEVNSEASKKMPIVDSSFTITARVPFGRDSMIMFTALHPKSQTIAVFVGQYKLCAKQELIIGRWTVEKYAHQCEVEINEDTYGDVLRRPKKF